MLLPFTISTYVNAQPIERLITGLSSIHTKSTGVNMTLHAENHTHIPGINTHSEYSSCKNKL